ncbi:hypothetical protein PB01_06220 [Psychrobacillus glaciei]|uniref:Uncharacterized protein n=1 Tax=Psychrobacillus glaciei TaxID=2283160 RepID=A0A5J6SLS0_9BACI|nr:hypothetical protein PB01_06220 [Psychrobacillus glaciei]
MKPRLTYIVNLVVTVICIMIFPIFIMKSHPFYGFVIGIILATILNRLLGAKWRPGKLIK